MAGQGQIRDYAFHTLGWYQFQKLCQTILTDLLGQTVQVFSPGNDGGRDAAFSGTWKPVGNEDLSGSFTFQVKYSRRAEFSLGYADLDKEVEKAKELVRLGLADNVVEREPSIAELMRHEMNPRLAGSRGRRRRRLSTPVQRNPGATRTYQQPAARVGRPTIGSEPRVHVQTMIAQETRDILVRHHVTLADVFDDCARRLSRVP